MSDSIHFRELLLKEVGDELSEDQRERLVLFREEVLKEEEFQNLTRLLSPEDFLEGHVWDVIHLKRSGLLTFPALDLGAGMGVPGLLYALVYGLNAGEAMISCDSERMKADFSDRMIEKFNIAGARASCERAEVFLDSHAIDSVVARAVGPVLRIYNWIKPCSTWNKLVLLKGPKWEEEWKEFQQTSQRRSLEIGRSHTYQVGALKKSRIILELFRND